MRLQRHGMVQTEASFHFRQQYDFIVLILSFYVLFALQDQYIFCYQVILYVLRCLQAEENISG